MLAISYAELDGGDVGGNALADFCQHPGRLYF
jgi:hypothetical protein